MPINRGRSKKYKTWEVDICYNGHRYRKTVRGSYEEAQAVYAEMIKAIQAQPIVDKKNMTVRQFGRYMFKNIKDNQAVKTTEAEQNIWPRIDVALGDIKINSVKPPHILAFFEQLKNCHRMDGREGGLGDNTIHKYYLLLRKLFRNAKKWGFIIINPMDGIDPPRFSYKSKKEIMDSDELSRFLKEVEKNEPMNHRLWVMLGLLMGMRRGEIFGLRWGDINWKEETISISRESQPKVGGGVIFTSTKNRSSERIISAPDSIISLLKNYREEEKKRQAKMMNLWQGLDVEDDEAQIFVGFYGKPSSPHSFFHWLRTFCNAHGYTHLSPHSLRHMSASYLIREGVDIQTVASRLGHSNTTTTQLIYSHLLKSAERGTANVMESIYQNLKKGGNENEDED